MAVTIRVLGGFEVVFAGGLRGDGGSLSLPTRKAQALLARLARRPGVAVPRATLADLLWPDRPEEQGRQSLRQALAAIRVAFRAAGASGPTSGGDVVALDPTGVTVDVAEVDAALAAGPEGAGRAALAYRGPFLAGFPPLEDGFDAWVEEERSALGRRVVAAASAAAAAREAAGDAGGALEVAAAALAADPTCEPAARVRMRLLAARGDRAGALREHAALEAALGRALSVAPAAETEALRRAIAAAPADGAAAAPYPTLAVLPFELLSAAPDHEVFARGLAEDVLAALARFRPLRVVARAPALRSGEPGGDPVEAGRALGADYALAASVRPGPGRLRVSARLVDVRTGRQLWAERVDAELADLFGVQDRLTRSVAGALTLRIDEAELTAALRRPPESLDVYALWVRGMALLRQGTRASDLEARALFERALARDPAFARAYTGLSLSHFNDWSCAAWERWDDNERRAFDYAEQAVRLDAGDHVGHCILGRVLLYRREFERAREHLERAEALNPSDADVLAHLALGFAYLGEPARGDALGAEARRLNPAHPDWYLVCHAVNHLVARRAADALALLERAPDGYVDTRAMMAVAYVHAGDLARARDCARRFVARWTERIARGVGQPPEAPAAWVVHVNPLRRAEDRGWLLDGLAAAGLPVAVGERG